jgi:peptide-methionine (S)-S-oxide reductase
MEYRPVAGIRAFRHFMRLIFMFSTLRLIGLVGPFAILALFGFGSCTERNRPSATRPPLTVPHGPTAKAVLGAGCFWCVEAMYEQVPGVVSVVSGYAGGPEKNPTYDAVSSGRTGHAEVVEIEYDPAVVSYSALLEFFWKTHDPTDGRGVAPDFGPQYRSIILYGNDAERAAAESARDAEAKRRGKPIATELVALDRFYPAEDYHQDYVWKNPGQGYVRAVAIPKLRKLGLKTP